MFLKLLSDEATQALGLYEGVLLHLNGLTMLSEKAAKALSEIKGQLSFNGLRDISKKATEALSRHKDQLYLNGLTGICRRSCRIPRKISMITTKYFSSSFSK